MRHAIAQDEVLKLRAQSLEIERLQPGQGGANAQVQLDPGSHRVCLTFVDISQVLSGLQDVPNPWVSLPHSSRGTGLQKTE